jgi:hypothetical protein
MNIYANKTHFVHELYEQMSFCTLKKELDIFSILNFSGIERFVQS